MKQYVVDAFTDKVFSGNPRYRVILRYDHFSPAIQLLRPIEKAEGEDFAKSSPSAFQLSLYSAISSNLQFNILHSWSRV